MPAPIINTPIWIAHRGYHQGHQENSRAAFMAAQDRGFHCLETDLRADKEGNLVLSHDPDMSRLGGPSTPLTQLSHADLCRVRLSNGEPPLFFEEFADLFSASLWVFDIKVETGHRVIAGLNDWLARSSRRAWFFKKSWFLFWHQDQEQLFLKIFPEARIFAGESECWRAGLWQLPGLPGRGPVKKGRSYALPPALWGMNLFRENLVRRYQLRGAGVIAYLPTTEASAREATGAGVDFILTDYDRLPHSGA